MSIEESVGDAAAAAIAGGSAGMFSGLLDGITHALETGLVEASTAGDVHVELDKLIGFYNTLSGLHDTLVGRQRALQEQALAQHGENAGGSVAGARAAWDAIADSAGMSAAEAASLTANMRQVDELILSHMAALQHNAEQYAAQENRSIAGFGKVATVADDVGASIREVPGAATHVQRSPFAR